MVDSSFRFINPSYDLDIDIDIAIAIAIEFDGWFFIWFRVNSIFANEIRALLFVVTYSTVLYYGGCTTSTVLVVYWRW
jgi:hypothetical protein